MQEKFFVEKFCVVDFGNTYSMGREKEREKNEKQ